MHISEGILPPSLLLAGGLIAAAGTARGLRSLADEDIPKVAVLTSAFFVASLIHVPVGAGSVHLVLNGLIGLLLGWAAFPAILVGLFLQALLFGYGGLTVLGVNLTIMAAPAVLAGYGARAALTHPRGAERTGPVGFAAGALTISMSAALLTLTLVYADARYTGAAMTLMALHLPLAITEGVVTAGILLFLRRVRPRFMDNFTVITTP